MSPADADRVFADAVHAATSGRLRRWAEDYRLAAAGTLGGDEADCLRRAEQCEAEVARREAGQVFGSDWRVAR